MKIIPHDKITAAAIQPLDCYRWVSEAMTQKAASALPPKTSIKPPNGGGDEKAPSLIPCRF